MAGKVGLTRLEVRNKRDCFFAALKPVVHLQPIIKGC
jgi:hypothetical protein